MLSSRDYHDSRPDLILLAVTSQSQPATDLGEATVSDWKGAGLIKPSALKPLITTIERKLVIKRLGALQPVDRERLKHRQAMREC